MNKKVELDDRSKYLQGHPVNLTVNQKFRILLKYLKEQFPPEHEVRVKRLSSNVLGPDAPYGTCQLVNSSKPKSKRYFLICVRKADPWNIQVDTLLHEWAHALTWYQLPDGKDHGDQFARKYGVLYRAFIED
jgi:hypothetical protein